MVSTIFLDLGMCFNDLATSRQVERTNISFSYLIIFWNLYYYHFYCHPSCTLYPRGQQVGEHENFNLLVFTFAKDDFSGKQIWVLFFQTQTGGCLPPLLLHSNPCRYLLKAGVVAVGFSGIPGACPPNSGVCLMSCITLEGELNMMIF